MSDLIEFTQVTYHMKIEILNASSTRLHKVVIDGVDYGDFDDIDIGTYCFFPKKQDRLTGDHYIAIGKALNALNETGTPLHSAEDESELNVKNKIIEAHPIKAVDSNRHNCPQADALIDHLNRYR
jgi:hypothetical protein